MSRGQGKRRKAERDGGRRATERQRNKIRQVRKLGDRTCLRLNLKIMASGPITSWEIDGETVEIVSDFIFWGLQNHCGW